MSAEDEELARAIADKLDIARLSAEQILGGARHLWDMMADLSLVDAYGGMECQRVLPEAVLFIYRQANRPPVYDWELDCQGQYIRQEGRVRVLTGPMAGRVGIVVAMADVPPTEETGGTRLFTVRIDGLPYGPYNSDQVEVVT